MKGETLASIVLIAIGVVLIAFGCLRSGELVGKRYVEVLESEYVDVGTTDEQWVEVGSTEAQGHDLTAFGEDRRIRWTDRRTVTKRDYAAAQNDPATASRFQFSLSRTVGVWFAAVLTLAIFSFLYRDNPMYKAAEAMFIGVSAAYWMVVAFWTTIVPNLFGKIAPDMVTAWALPGLKEPANYWYVIPLILGIMLLWRLAPKGAWIARWPLALFIGVFCGLRLVGYLHGDFLQQIRNAIVPLAVVDPDNGFDIWESLRNVILVGGLLVCLVYFFFSFEHKGFVGKTARVGIWVLMITFGAGFGYTVMGRIALLAIRLEFLFDDWLWLVDPSGSRVIAGA